MDVTKAFSKFGNIGFLRYNPGSNFGFVCFQSTGAFSRAFPKSSVLLFLFLLLLLLLLFRLPLLGPEHIGSYSVRPTVEMSFYVWIYCLV